jgi:hypothetical protein
MAVFRLDNVRMNVLGCWEKKSKKVILMIVIEIKPHRWGWKVFEAPGVEPVFPEKRQAINYAENRAWFRSGEIRILNSPSDLERSIPFSGRIGSCDARYDAESRNLRSAALDPVRPSTPLGK